MAQQLKTLSLHTSVVWHSTFFDLYKQLQAGKSGKATSERSPVDILKKPVLVEYVKAPKSCKKRKKF